MGDVVSLVEKAAETVDQEEAEKLAAKMREGRVRPRRSRRAVAPDPPDGRDERHARRCCRGSARSRSSWTTPISTRRIIKRQEAIISLDDQGRAAQPEAAERLAPAAHRVGLGHLGAGVNRLLKQYQDMAEMMKKMKKLGQKGLMRHGLAGAAARARH